MISRAGLAALALLSSMGCASSPWRELDSIDDLRVVFNEDSGRARVVLLLSPT